VVGEMMGEGWGGYEKEVEDENCNIFENNSEGEKVSNYSSIN
jgi:hypothetical protein